MNIKNKNFSERIDNLIKEKRASKENIQIWGGEIKKDELNQFISKWDKSNMHFVIMETIKEITISGNFNFSYLNLSMEEIGLLERIRIFGEGGDLDLRRKDTDFIWRYVGENKPPSGIKGNDFWGNKKHLNKKFFIEEKDALLWGKYDSNKKLWYEDRVARAKLMYPIDENSIKEMVKIHYKVLSMEGSISFVWFVKIYGGKKNE